LAWLHSAPKQNNKDESPKSRLSTLDKENPARRLPEVDSYLSMCFELSGFCLMGAMGAIPLTWSEVNSFAHGSGYQLTGWQSEHLIKMSRDYCYMLSKGADVNCPAPYQEGYNAEDMKQKMRDKVAKQWESFSGNLKVK